MVEVLNPQPFVFHRIGNSWIKGKIDINGKIDLGVETRLKTKK